MYLSRPSNENFFLEEFANQIYINLCFKNAYISTKKQKICIKQNSKKLNKACTRVPYESHISKKWHPEMRESGEEQGRGKQSGEKGERDVYIFF